MPNQEYTTFVEGVSIVSTTAGAGSDLIYTVPNNHDAEVSFLTITHGTGTDSINILMYHSADDTYHYLLRDYKIQANGVYSVITQARLYLHQGDKILAYKVGGVFDVSISGKLFYNPVRNI